MGRHEWTLAGERPHERVVAQSHLSGVVAEAAILHIEQSKLGDAKGIKGATQLVVVTKGKDTLVAASNKHIRFRLLDRSADFRDAPDIAGDETT
jgi:NAD(P)H-hydrate repair Nnr-like enzyme with NAD(P)H-hydrate dehydratase domain